MSAPAPDRIGFRIPIVSDAAEGLADAVSNFGDFVKTIPGGDWIVTAINNGADFIGDIAKSKFGQFLLTAIASSMYAGLANLSVTVPGAAASMPLTVTVGPQLAAVVFALPGVVAGDDFAKAWTTAFIDRVTATIAYFAGVKAGEVFAQGGDVVKAGFKDAFTDETNKLIQNPEVKQQIDQFKAKLGSDAAKWTKEELARAGITPERIAAQFNTRADAAAATIDYHLHKMVYPFGKADPKFSDFDAKGNPFKPTPQPALQFTSSPDINVQRQVLRDKLSAYTDKGNRGVLFDTEADPYIDALRSVGLTAEADALAKKVIAKAQSNAQLDILFPQYLELAKQNRLSAYQSQYVIQALQNLGRNDEASQLAALNAPVPPIVLPPPPPPNVVRIKSGKNELQFQGPPPGNGGVLANLFRFALLTSPAWIPIYALPRLRKSRTSRK